jgi:hypothetical protein
MVGVPALVEWEAGPSSRICWPICFSVKVRINQGPNKNEISSDNNAAIAARKVM